MLRLRISKFFDFVSHKKNGFQSVKTDCKFEDTHGLISNIELKCIDKVDKVSGGGGGGESGGSSKDSPTSRNTDHDEGSLSIGNGSSPNNVPVPKESEGIIPPRSLENRVYSSPSEEIMIPIGGGFGDFGILFSPKGGPSSRNNNNRRGRRGDESSVMLESNYDNGPSRDGENDREGILDGNHNNQPLTERHVDQDEESGGWDGMFTHPKQVFMMLVICLIGLVLLSATMITSFMLKSHDSSLITKMKGGQVKQPESVSLDTASVSKFGVIPDLHDKFPNGNETKGGNKSRESLIHEIIMHVNINNNTATGKPGESSSVDNHHHRGNSYEEQSIEIHPFKEKVTVESKSSSELRMPPRPVLSEYKMAMLGQIIEESANEEFSNHYSQIIPVDPQLQGDSNETNYIIREGFFREELYRRIVERDNLTVLEANEGLILFEHINLTLPSDKCTPSPKIACEGFYEYRSFDGSCNNLRHPAWGKANEPYRRIAFPVYEDGISSPRSEAKDGGKLPNPREVSVNVHLDEFRVDSEATLLLRIWAQFVEHDILNTVTVPTSSVSSCCDAPLESECISIEVPKNDSFYQDKGVHCLPVARSAPHFMNCSLGPREQFNQMSSYIDASNIYGSSLAQNKALRYIDYGRLRTSHTEDRKSLLPIRPDPNDPCNQLRKDEVQRGHFCFLAGDPDVNKEATLTALHTIWVRHHNHVAKILFKYNPHWNDERIFQETRRIISAQIQHITYNEFLPEILPEKLLEMKSLKLKEHGEFFEEYDANVDPTISNVFTTVFQFTQSMVQGLVKTIYAEWKNEDYEQIHKLLNNPFMLWTDGKLGAIIRGIISQNAQQVDHYISGQLTHMYNQNESAGHGLDLVAEIIQRGRDHGLPPYLQWRVECGLPNATEFKDLEKVWDSDAMDKIRATYKSVKDVDLFTGMLAEKHILGGRVGPTISCLIADQFSRLRKGDRFWYEGNIYMKRFSIDQLNELRKTTLARVLCDSGEGIKSISLRPMIITSRANPLADCSDVPKVSFSLWREKTNSSSSSLDLSPEKDDKEKSSLDDFMTELGKEWIDSYEYSEEKDSFNHAPSNPSGNLISFAVKNNTRL